MFGMWEGYRSRGIEEKIMRFGVTKLMGMTTLILRGYSFYKVVIRMNDKTSREYIMENQTCKLSCRIVDDLGALVAQVI